MIKFNKPMITGDEIKYIAEAFAEGKTSAAGKFTRKCEQILKQKTGAEKVILTNSATAALEMSSLLIDFEDQDEIIMPSYTFVSTANAFLLSGATPVFVDIREDTMNIDEDKIEAAITEKTRAICVVHYAGVACNMDKIMEIAKKHQLLVVEDAAQAVNAYYKGKALGTIGDFGCFSFHDTKNYSMGEGGALLINNKRFIERADILSEKGTNRKDFMLGKVEKYVWTDKGSSYMPSDILAAALYPQLLKMEMITENRKKSWNLYRNLLKTIQANGKIDWQIIDNYVQHNYHMLYIKCKNIEERAKLIVFLQENGVESAFHYVPLHSSVAGIKYGRFDGEDRFTTKESERLLRLPLYYGLKTEEITYICALINKFFD